MNFCLLESHLVKLSVTPPTDPVSARLEVQPAQCPSTHFSPVVALLGLTIPQTEQRSKPDSITYFSKHIKMGDRKRKSKIKKTCTFLMENNGFVPPSQLEKMADKSRRSGRRSSMGMDGSLRSHSTEGTASSPGRSIRRCRTMDSVSRGTRARKRVIGLSQPKEDTLEGDGLFVR